GEKDFVKAALAVLANMQPKTIENIISAKSAKGIVSLTWKAGLSMKIGEHLQLKIARIQPRDVLGASSGSDFPLSEDEMKWQLDFLGEL
ncbi:MAG TPA: DUF2336 domain-containing protein, partial [Rhodospirillales bacterium]|nr:DUF2336 domain-containing protein [Rhodospirillales bacterium]